MAYSKYKLIRELHKKYYFIESHSDRFGKILFDSIPDDATYEEALKIGTENIINSIIYRINNKLFPRLFNRTVKRIGIEKAFDLYNNIIQTTGHQINPYDLLKICGNTAYSSFLKSAEPNGNKLLEDTLDMYNSDTEINMPSKRMTPELKEYIKWITEFPLLKNKEEEDELISKYRQTGDNEYKEQFINSNLRLAVSIVLKKYNQTEAKLGLLDLIQAGNIGLIKAFDKFDETKGFKFSTYATYWIKSEIDELICKEGDTIRIPEGIVLKINRIQMFKNEYLYKHGYEAPEEEIRKHFNIDEKNYDLLKKYDEMRKTLSYDVRIHDGFELFDGVDFSELAKQTEEMEYESIEESPATIPISEEEKEEIEYSKEPIIKLPVSSDTLEEMSFNDELYLSIMNLIPDTETTSVEDEAIRKALTKQMLIYAINTLKPNELKVILEECGFNKERWAKQQIQIGKEIGLTHQRIGQIEAYALQNLQSHAYKINNGVPVEQEYFSSKDIKKELKKKGIETILILDHQLYNKNTKFKCTECGNEFKENVNVFLKIAECPFCKEENKQLIKK